ncbi:MAG: LLM class flavin-dependent oxidoreductase, partial [Candidatus Limnocylindria bacterium]
MEGTDRTFVEPFVTLSFVAGVTSSIGLGFATLIPYRHPVHMAYSIASLSWITRRSIDVGIGAGNFQHEFEVIGQGDLKRPELMREHALIARRLWTEDGVGYRGDAYAFDDVDLKPKPRSVLPIWWGGATPASVRLAVDFCDGWLPGRITFPTYEARITKIRELTGAQDKPMIMTGAVPVTSIGTTTAEALDRLNVPGLLQNANGQRFWIRPPSGEFSRAEELEGSILAGSPDDVVRDVLRYQAIGCDLLIFDLRMRFDDWLAQITVLAEEVLPRVRKDTAKPGSGAATPSTPASPSSTS